MKFLFMFIPFIVGACGTMGSKEISQTVSKVDIPKFMGPWYVQANIPTFLEKGAHNAVETYIWNEQEQRIDVDFRFNKDAPDGEVKTIPQKAWVYDKTTNAEWRVQPFWPLKFAYLIIDLAPDYSYTIIGVPNKKHVWIMSRAKSLPPAKLEALIAKVTAMGYDPGQIVKIPQK